MTIHQPGLEPGGHGAEPGSRWAANVSSRSVSPCGVDPEAAEEPHEQRARVRIVVHVATAEVVCHAGGREFES
jgi:hypothetical protein